MYISSGSILFVRIKTIFRDWCTFHRGMYCLLGFKQSSGTGVHFIGVCTVCSDETTFRD